MPSDISLHDKFFKVSLRDKAIAVDFFKNHLPSDVREQVDLETLKLEPNEYIDKKQHSHASDILYSVKIENKPGFLYV